MSGHVTQQEHEASNLNNAEVPRLMTLIDGLRRDLAAWEAFRESVQQWLDDAKSDRIATSALPIVLAMMPAPATPTRTDANGGRA